MSVKTTISAATTEAIAQASEMIRNGGLVAMPTETVYGLAADATDDVAVARIFEAKGRPQFNPLIVHVADIAMAAQYVDVSPLAENLAAAFWPGPLTMVLARRGDSAASLLTSAGLDTLGVRAPDHRVAQALIHHTDRPLAAPSANRSGTISPTRAAHVQDSLGDKIEMILDGGPCRVGLESTILKINHDDLIILRPGIITQNAIEEASGKTVKISTSTKIEAPGMMTSHYAPDAKVRLNVTSPTEEDAFLAFGPRANNANEQTLNLSPTGDLVEAAANLFDYFRRLDRICAEKNLSTIAVAPIPQTGLGIAINDRLRRAAAPRL